VQENTDESRIEEILCLRVLVSEKSADHIHLFNKTEHVLGTVKSHAVIMSAHKSMSKDKIQYAESA
jgi:hypothetical protein